MSAASSREALGFNWKSLWFQHFFYVARYLRRKVSFLLPLFSTSSVDKNTKAKTHTVFGFVSCLLTYGHEALNMKLLCLVFSLSLAVSTL
jgi:hypothetical protein